MLLSKLNTIQVLLASYVRGRVTDRGLRWLAPKQDQLKLNADASFKDVYVSSIVGILCDKYGRIVWCYGEHSKCVDIRVVRYCRSGVASNLPMTGEFGI